MTLFGRFLQILLILGGGFALFLGGACVVMLFEDQGMWKPSNRFLLVMAFCAIAFLLATAAMFFHTGFVTFRRIVGTTSPEERSIRLLRALAASVVAVAGLGFLMIGGTCTIGVAAEGDLGLIAQVAVVIVACFAAAYGLFRLWRRLRAGA
jgi:uncharacterized membrane protein